MLLVYRFFHVVSDIQLTNRMVFSFRLWNSSLLDFALEELRQEFTLVPGAPGGRESYRISLVLSFFLKFFLSVSSEITGVRHR